MAMPSEIDLADAPAVERALDVDSHEMVPTELREEIFGHTELHDVLVEHVLRKMPKDHPNRTRGENVTGDDTPIDYETVWKLKGGTAC